MQGVVEEMKSAGVFIFTGGLANDASVFHVEPLRLMFTCTHPALQPAARLAATLRLVAGLTVAEIARALLSSEPAVGRSITRAKAKIRDAHIPFVIREPLTDRLQDVLTVIYLSFNEGYLPGAGTELRVDLCDEAIRPARLLPDEPETAGLLALLLTDPRRAGHPAQAHAAYTRAIELANNPAGARHLTRRRSELARPGHQAAAVRQG